jgi:hypothetical protein
MRETALERAEGRCGPRTGGLPVLPPNVSVEAGGQELRGVNRQVEGITGVTSARVKAIDGRPFPLHVGGEHIADFTEIEDGVSPGGLLGVA